MAAPLARERLLRLKAIPLRLALTLGALMALAEANVEQMLKTSFVVRELSKELANVGLFHAPYIAFQLPYGKGIHPYLWGVSPQHTLLLDSRAGVVG